MKDIILPFSCETAEKIKRIIIWSILIIFPTIFIYGILLHYPQMALFGSVFSFLVWFGRIIIWVDDTDLPSFKCKCD